MMPIFLSHLRTTFKSRALLSILDAFVSDDFGALASTTSFLLLYTYYKIKPTPIADSICCSHFARLHTGIPNSNFYNSSPN